MANDTLSSKRYAQAAFDVAGDALDKWQDELNSLAAGVENPDLAALVENPRVPAQTKRDTLNASLPGLSAKALNLATILAVKGRLKMLARPIATAFQAMVDQKRGIARIDVTTAVQLDVKQQTQISENIGKVTGMRVQASYRVNPAIQGGMIVRVGDRVLDGSVRSKLEGLRRSLVG